MADVIQRVRNLTGNVSYHGFAIAVLPALLDLTEAVRRFGFGDDAGDDAHMRLEAALAALERELPEEKP